jgi:DeoR/GlpR family transcriptional regulator of sugar metabolism
MSRTADTTLPGERLGVIVERLRRDGRVIAAELAAEFHVSEDSIRRDLRELAAAGQCKRVYGGALQMGAFAPLRQRDAEHIARKQALARAAATLVLPGQIVFIDAGSTNTQIAAALPARQGLTIVTNAPDVANALLGREGFDVILLGGKLHHHIGGAIGAQTVAQVRGMRADLCIPGICAVDAQSGIWTYDAEENVLKQAMIQASGETILVATAEKLQAAATHFTAPLTVASTLVSEAVAGSLLDMYRGAGLATLAV